MQMINFINFTVNSHQKNSLIKGREGKGHQNCQKLELYYRTSVAEAGSPDRESRSISSKL